MALLPKTTSEFKRPEYWNKFFKKRGLKAFEWYGEYPELAILFNKYLKNLDDILMVGCGNSKLTAELYDVGYKKITSIDVSEVVIKQMTSANAESRPDLKFMVMDALNTTFEDNKFSVVLDKGTLDALMPDDTPESKETASKLFKEVGRVLRLGGRYVIISLLQEHILQSILAHFPSEGWMMRICRCTKAEEKTAGESQRVLPVFMVVCTKFKRIENAPPVLEFCPTEESKAVRLDSVQGVVDTIKEIQEVSKLIKVIETCNLSGEYIAVDIAMPGSSDPKYKVIIVDRKDASVNSMTYASFIVPQGRDAEWIFVCEEGRQFLRDEVKVDRLAVVILNRGYEFTDIEQVKLDISPIIQTLAPKNHQGRINFLSLGTAVGVRQEIYRGKSDISGDFVVEETETEGKVRLRRLYFLGSQNIIQSEAKIRIINSKKKKRIVVDTDSLCCNHHSFMVVGACSILDVTSTGNILVIGLGGGSLCTYLKKCFPKVKVTAVELDPAMKFVATQYFGLEEDKNLSIEIQDGIAFIQETAMKGNTKYNVVIFDVDSKDVSSGISCPPKAFMASKVLRNVEKILTPNGIFVLNLVCRDKSIRRDLYEVVSKIFGCVGLVALEDDLNELIFCWKEKGIDFKKMIGQASLNFEEVVRVRRLEKVSTIQLEKLARSLTIS